MTDVKEQLSDIAEAGVWHIELRRPDGADAPRRTRVSGFAAAGASLLVVVIVAVAIAIFANGSSSPETASRGGVRSDRTADTSYTIPSEGMLPTLQPEDVVAATTKFETIERGDVVFVKLPDDRSPVSPPRGGETVVKRVVGLPGDVVEGRDGKVFVNGTELAEPYLPDGLKTEPGFAAVTVASDAYYILGDNRPNSMDSRFYGAVPRADVDAVALAITAPEDRRGSIPGSPR